MGKYLYLLLLFKEFIKCMCLVNINVDTTGLLIPYSIGALGYIKTNLCLKNYHLTGISGGSFASVIYHYEKDMSNHDVLWNKIIGDDNYVIKFNKNLDEFQQIVKKNMLNLYKNNNINDIPISIIVSKINNYYKISNEKINKFNNIEELIDFCICSSYIPYIGGYTFSKKYKENYYIDGGIFKNLHHFDCVDKCENSIYIHINMNNRTFNFKDFLYLNKDTSRQLFQYGWDDCKQMLQK